ncbi:hypothetical protein JG687_00002515 [Phytophthora cactorum]|uniref:Uncharacterized protein n=1 Tax=Phytophthora cactorum TaxID=29920 RepID=A0A8T1UWQ6_9STRA|nr:hypothetical protein JG687_00002515 [Phytophthora cactorum]
MDTEFNAAISARECDALRDENVTPLPASQSHVVFRLRREEDEKVPWIVELVFLLFNAQDGAIRLYNPVTGALLQRTMLGECKSTTSITSRSNFVVLTYIPERFELCIFQLQRPDSSFQVMSVASSSFGQQLGFELLSRIL